MYVSARPCSWITCIHTVRLCVCVCILVMIVAGTYARTDDYDGEVGGRDGGGGGGGGGGGETSIRAQTRAHGATRTSRRRGSNIDVLLIIKILIRTSHNVHYVFEPAKCACVCVLFSMKR